ncbi:ATP-dependent DNA helicase PIF1-like [Dendronephthya gigantea]|uniref:ATP-dependent DNA helicase PIF1-like n=1 Tax=Dendronephthya gigantea TaxID=151771 RepID=UPI00106BACBF|nr:ATP-dependent DNA helicase PIF1-like [Dendronephthya gigantea]
MLSHNTYPFGGIQVLLVGDFCQLPPIRTVLDAGRPVYESDIFKRAFSHRIELKEVKRQGASEERLKKALDQLRTGKCDEETETYFHALSRGSEEFDNPRDTVHIYFRKFPVEVHNVDVLVSLPGELLVFESIDTGSPQYLESTVPKFLTLKPECNVMLLFNINDHLKNGCRGRFVRVNEDGQLFVYFAKVGTVCIERRTWYKYDRNGGVKASRTQFPISPCYAITVHKAQGLTIDRAVVHCSQEFVTGLTYVAISRVREESALQVIGFRRKFLLPLPNALSSLLENNSDPNLTFQCCGNVQLDDCLFQCKEYNQVEEDDRIIDCDMDDNDAGTFGQLFFEENTGQS